MSKAIDQIPEADRPREKLLRKGAPALSDQELLAILLGKGTPGMDVMTLAAKLTRLIDEKGLEVKVEDLTQFEGVGDAKGTLILAAIEFARRRIKPEGAKIETPADLLPHVRHYADRKQEHFLCATINGANEILNILVVSIGLIDRSPVHPREVFADALSDRASAVIVAHNHPSGQLEPSPGDVNITAQLKAAGAIVGIELLDHIIFNRTGYFSFLEDGRLEGGRWCCAIRRSSKRRLNDRPVPNCQTGSKRSVAGVPSWAGSISCQRTVLLRFIHSRRLNRRVFWHCRR